MNVKRLATHTPSTYEFEARKIGSSTSRRFIVRAGTAAIAQVLAVRHVDDDERLVLTATDSHAAYGVEL